MPGIDGIPAEVFMGLPSIFGKPMFDAVSQFLAQGSIPTAWALGIMNPIPKNQGSISINELRPICLCAANVQHTKSGSPIGDGPLGADSQHSRKFNAGPLCSTVICMDVMDASALCKSLMRFSFWHSLRYMNIRNKKLYLYRIHMAPMCCDKIVPYAGSEPMTLNVYACSEGEAESKRLVITENTCNGFSVDL